MNVMPKLKELLDCEFNLTPDRVVQILRDKGAKVTKVSLWKEAALVSLLTARGYNLTGVPAQLLVVEFPGIVVAFDANADWKFKSIVVLEGEMARSTASDEFNKDTMPELFLVSGQDRLGVVKVIVSGLEPSEAVPVVVRKYKAEWAYDWNDPVSVLTNTLVGTPEEMEGDFVPPLGFLEYKFLEWED